MICVNNVHILSMTTKLKIMFATLLWMKTIKPLIQKTHLVAKKRYAVGSDLMMNMEW